MIWLFFRHVLVSGTFWPCFRHVLASGGLAADAADPEVLDARDGKFGGLMRPSRAPSGGWIEAQTAAGRGSDAEAIQRPIGCRRAAVCASRGRATPAATPASANAQPQNESQTQTQTSASDIRVRT